MMKFNYNKDEKERISKEFDNNIWKSINHLDINVSMNLEKLKEEDFNNNKQEIRNRWFGEIRWFPENLIFMVCIIQYVKLRFYLRYFF